MPKEPKQAMEEPQDVTRGEELNWKAGRGASTGARASVTEAVESEISVSEISREKFNATFNDMLILFQDGPGHCRIKAKTCKIIIFIKN